jgi:kynurenine---oxoglutarate transaminase / cysteine-S-conjugate beta-lyase / glutamine---phenylpyruvate transaminase
MRRLAHRLKGYDFVNVWQEFSGLANEFKAVNLGQGFPDWSAPNFVKQKMVEAVNGDFNQYCRPPGDISLVRSLAKSYSPLFERELNADKEITITVGATEALFSCMQTFLNAGDKDEVVVLEPAFDIYAPQIQMAGGKATYVTLQPPKQHGTVDGVSNSDDDHLWKLDISELEAAINSNTRILLLNTPHNPTGWVMSEKQAHDIANILRKNPQVICITDEVYDRLVYAPYKHTRLATLPGMWNRVLTVGSAGKTFSVTGWKIGWVIGCEALIKSVMLCNQWVQFSVSTPAQVAIAGALDVAGEIYHKEGNIDDNYSNELTYYDYINKMYISKLTRLGNIFYKFGIPPLSVQGTYYLLLDITYIFGSGIIPKRFLFNSDGTEISPDYAFSRWLVEEVGVCVIPCSAFYTNDKKHIASHLVRVASCKTDETLMETERRLAKILRPIHSNDTM